MVATDDGKVFLIGVGIGIMQSTDGGFTFSSIAARQNIRWPSITADGHRVWASWNREGKFAEGRGCRRRIWIGCTGCRLFVIEDADRH